MRRNKASWRWISSCSRAIGNFLEMVAFAEMQQVDPLASDPDIVEPGTGQPNLEPGLRKEHDRRRRVATVETVELIVQ